MKRISAFLSRGVRAANRIAGVAASATRRPGRAAAWVAVLILTAGLLAGESLAQSAGDGAQTVGTSALAFFEPVVQKGLHGFFELLDKQKFVFLLLALGLGYPLGRVSFGGISLGPTAGTLLVGVVIAIIAKLAFDITYSIPGLVSTVFLLMFMYALGLRVGPQFFAGLKSGGLAFIMIGIVVWALNWVIAFGGVKIVGPINLPSQIPYHASQMYGRNVTTFLNQLVKEGEMTLDLEDEVVTSTLVTNDGEVVHPMIREKLGMPAVEASIGSDN